MKKTRTKSNLHGKAITLAGKYWTNDLMQELASLRLDPLRIDVVVRSCVF